MFSNIDQQSTKIHGLEVLLIKFFMFKERYDL